MENLGYKVEVLPTATREDLLTGREVIRILALPKGHIDEGESSAEAAAREVREETGVEASLVEKLGDVRYWYQRDGQRVLKVVTFFLFRYRSGSVRNHDHEVDSAEWVPLEDAPRLLAYKGERQMAEAEGSDPPYGAVPPPDRLQGRLTKAFLFVAVAVTDAATLRADSIVASQGCRGGPSDRQPGRRRGHAPITR